MQPVLRLPQADRCSRHRFCEPRVENHQSASKAGSAGAQRSRAAPSARRPPRQPVACTQAVAPHQPTSAPGPLQCLPAKWDEAVAPAWPRLRIRQASPLPEIQAAIPRRKAATASPFGSSPVAGSPSVREPPLALSTVKPAGIESSRRHPPPPQPPIADIPKPAPTAPSPATSPRPRSSPFDDATARAPKASPGHPVDTAE